jgi:hypothetical protein
VVAKVWEGLAIIKDVTMTFDGDTFILRKLNQLEDRKQYQIEIKNRFAALENLRDDEDIYSAWENTKENIQTSAKERLGLHKLK